MSDHLGMNESGISRHRRVESTKDRRPRLKSLAATSAQERRRQEFISNQKQVREKHLIPCHVKHHLPTTLDYTASNASSRVVAVQWQLLLESISPLELLTEY